MSQPARAVWIEITVRLYNMTLSWSQPARAVWIEIIFLIFLFELCKVTACEGCVE